jgi:hypothetical protein
MKKKGPFKAKGNSKSSPASRQGYHHPLPSAWGVDIEREMVSLVKDWSRGLASNSGKEVWMEHHRFFLPVEFNPGDPLLGWAFNGFIAGNGKAIGILPWNVWGEYSRSSKVRLEAPEGISFSVFDRLKFDTKGRIYLTDTLLVAAGFNTKSKKCRVLLVPKSHKIKELALRCGFTVSWFSWLEVWEVDTWAKTEVSMKSQFLPQFPQ